MKLRKINDQTYVNVGGGNITSVVGGTPLSGPRWAAINFTSGKQLDVPSTKIEDVVKALESEPTTSWGGRA